MSAVFSKKILSPNLTPVLNNMRDKLTLELRLNIARRDREYTERITLQRGSEEQKTSEKELCLVKTGETLCFSLRLKPQFKETKETQTSAYLKQETLSKCGDHSPMCIIDLPLYLCVFTKYTCGFLNKKMY